jgi:release factor glutamine methyltransferase
VSSDRPTDPAHAAEASALFGRLLARLHEGLQTLPDKPEETAETALRCLWHVAAGDAVSPQAAVERPLPSLTAESAAALVELVDRRLSGTPLAHLCGRQRFMGLELLAGPEALIPRRETELLGRAAIEAVRSVVAERGCATVIDTCTGSGNLAAAIAYAEPAARVLACDLSSEAVGLARRNAHHIGVAERIELRAGDLLEPFDEPQRHGAVDVIVCNPPYISTKKMETMPGEIIGHEPRLAFDGGPLGVRILQRLIREAPHLLRPGGWLVFEVGLGQGPAVMQRMSASGHYASIDGRKDDEGQVRVVVARATRGPA